MSIKSLINKVKDVAQEVADTVSENTPDSVKKVVAKGADLAGDAFDKGKELAGDAYTRVSDETSFLNTCRNNRKFIEFALSNKDWVESFEELEATKE